MGAIKRLLEEEAAKLGTDDISGPIVIERVQKMLDIKLLERVCGMFCGVCDYYISSGELNGVPLTVCKVLGEVANTKYEEDKCEHFVIEEEVK